MKQKIIFSVLILLFLSAIGVIVAQSKTDSDMKDSWSKIESLIKKGLPESAEKELKTLETIAKKQNNQVELIKANLYRMRLIIDRDPDKTIELVREFEENIEKTDNTVQKALLHSMSAEMYAKYYHSDQFTINRRTELKGYTPEDVKEWTKQNFIDKILEHLDESLQNVDDLLAVSTKEYAELLDLGEDSPLIKPTMFDFLAYRKIDILSNLFAFDNHYPLENDDSDSKSINKSDLISDTYQLIIDKHSQNSAAWAYAKLEKLNYENKTKGEEYYRSLLALEKDLTTDEAQVELIAAKAEYLYEHFLNSNPEDNSRKEAYDLLENGIKSFPKAKRINKLKNLQNRILTQHVDVNFPTVIKPKTEQFFKLSSLNIDKVEITIYRVDGSALEYLKHKANRNSNTKLYPKHTKVFSKTIEIEKSENFHTVDSEITFLSNDYGIYEYIISYQSSKGVNEFATGSFVVTDFVSINRRADQWDDLFALDRKEGNPILEANLIVYNKKWNGKQYQFTKKADYKSDKQGLFKLLNSKNGETEQIIFERGADKYFSISRNSYGYYTGDSKEVEEQPQIALFTDRTLYRPGQSLFFKGIVYKRKKQEVEPNFKTTVTLHDVNGKRIAEKELRTNDFGSFEGSFTLPTDGLNGAYTLQSKYGSLTIWVEEYKRPTFEVEIHKPKEEVRFDETVQLKGVATAYAGYPMSDATVKYKIVRRPHRLWWWVNLPEKIIANGETTSNEKGEFFIEFTAKKDQTAPHHFIRIEEQYYTYHIISEVTDSKGETQTGESSFSVGDKSLFIVNNIPSKVDKKEELQLKATVQTLNGEAVEAELDYKLLLLDLEGKHLEDIEKLDSLKASQTILTGKFNTEKQDKLDLGKLNSGLYRLILSTKDNRGNLVTQQSHFTLYAKDDKNMPVNMYKWVIADNTNLKVGEEAQIKFGSSVENVHLLYELMKGQEVIERKWIKLNNEIKTFKIKYEESYGAGVRAVFSFVKDEKFYTEQVVLSKKVESKSIKPSVSVFRDKLRPNENAEWTIHIAETDDKARQAELLVSMYDASLDAIRPHAWYFEPTYREQMQHTPYWQMEGVRKSNAYAYSSLQDENVPYYKFDKLNWFGLNISADHRMYVVDYGRAAGSMLQKSMALVEESSNDIAYLREHKVIVNEDLDSNSYGQEEILVGQNQILIEQNQEEPIKIRENFNETAFFYPQLHTDANGNIRFSFTAPESLTRWNVNMLAHTRDLYFGQETMKVITQKELMVQLNLPRFVRKSDQLNLMANLVNLTDDEQTVSLTLELIEPSTDKLIQRFDTNKNELIAGKASKAFEWKLDGLKEFDFVLVKVIAKGDQFSDGEQRYLAVLPDEVLVSETQTLIARPGQERSFSFDSFIDKMSDVNNEKFVVEYSSNPSWYAVQALPSIAEPIYENAIDYSVAYYVNSLAHYMVNANPAIKPMIEQWKNAANSKDALLSNLEKNEELKLMLLSETPWVMDAENETEQKQSIAMLLDKNRNTNLSEKFLKKTLELQLPSGAFTWFKGMYESPYITLNIVENFARLQKMTKTELNKDAQLAIEKALNYLDKEIARQFAQLRKHNPNYHKQDVLTAYQLYYLYVRSDFKHIPLLEDAVAAVEFYTGQSEKYWTKRPLYSKALIATLAHRNGNNIVANDVMKSLKEFALQSDEMGMYWAENQNGFLWNMRAVSTQAALIETFAEVLDNPKELDELKIWLLKQKQTQNWQNPVQSVDAIYALLNYGSDWLKSQPNAKIYLGDQEVKAESKEAGSGYFKKSYESASLTADMGKIKVDATNNQTVSWGAAYWQYYEKPENIKAHGKELSVSKKLFVERVEANKKVMLPIEQVELQKGDKVITRLVLSTDRDLEYIALKDLRAANFEPVVQTSGYEWREGVGYYYTIKDASTQYFFDRLPKGTYVFEYASWVNNSGEFSSGITSAQCLYAPEFNAHSGGERIVVK